MNHPKYSRYIGDFPFISATARADLVNRNSFS